MKKVLVVRFSSIGDIVLTTPVIRALKNAGFIVHYITKESFAFMLRNNPNVDKVITIRSKVNEAREELLKEKYDFVADLHHNLRSSQVKRIIGKPSSSFPKLNLKKWLLVNAHIDTLPAIHIVDRYFETVKELGVKKDEKGLDYFIAPENTVALSSLPEKFRNGFIALTVGAKFGTKQMPVSMINKIIHQCNKPVVLLGGKEDMDRANEIEEANEALVYNTCGKLNLDQSASLIHQSELVVAHDTGLMHIAAAFGKKIFSVWGNTVPQLGMYPYHPGEGSKIIEVKDLYCRPCSKIGYAKCPKGHFRCMRDIDLSSFNS